MQKGFFSEDSADRIVPLKDNTGRELSLKTTYSYRPKGRDERRHLKIGKVVWGWHSRSEDKVIVLEQILFPEGPEVRFGYWTWTALNEGSIGENGGGDNPL